MKNLLTKRKISVSLTCSFIALWLFVSTLETTGQTNIALNKAVTVSSTESASYPGISAVDGDGSTRWASSFSDPQWIAIDLGTSYDIDRVLLSWEAAYGSAYEIQVSDNASTWNSIYSTSSGNGGIDDLTGLSGTGRYVRLYGISRGTSWGYSLWEFEVYGTESGGSSGGPDGYTFACNENEMVIVSGSVDIAYGADGQFNYLYNQSSDVACNNGTFGDPISGVFKACYVKPVDVSSCGEIQNNGFENDLTGWINNGNSSITSDSRSGSKALVTGTGEGGVHYDDAIAVQGGQEITFEAWGKVSGSPSWAGFGIDYLDASGTELSEVVFNVGATSYTHYSITENVPAGAVSISIWTWKSGTTGYFYLDDFCFSIAGGGDTQSPSVPTGLASSNVDQSSFSVSWNASSDNVGVTGYEVFLDGGSIGTTSSTSMNISDLSAGTTYSVRVRARDAAGNWSGQSSALYVTTSSGGGGSYTVTIDKSTQHQTIDGFGFFGAMNTWWSSPSTLYSDEWADMVISDLGISIWRNEYYPPADQYSGQDADWNKQLPVVQGLKAKADEYDVDLKFIFTVWSPPSSMKCLVENNTRISGTPHPYGTKLGGALDPIKYYDYADWLRDGIQLYKDLGIDLYAFSPQNEPFFVQSFNSCWYKQEWYPEMLRNVIPMVKSAYPDVKIFGSENMLEMEAADHNWQWFYHKQVLDDAQARNNIDILAVHGYSDGVAPSSGSTLAQYWANHKNYFAEPMGKKNWMTETSGYDDSWSANPGAFSLALDIMSGLNHGDMAGWVWWQGSENPGSSSIGEFALMNGMVRGKKYYASKQYYRYIRPGAVRVDASSTNDDIYVSAYQHSEMGTHTIVLINTSYNTQDITVGGSNLPGSFTIYRTSASDNCANVGTYYTGGNLSLPGRSIVTLQAGGVALKAAAMNDMLTDVQLKVSNEMKVYPNPVSNELFVEGPDDYSLQITNMSGQLISGYKNLSGKETIDIQALDAGVYMINLLHGANVYHEKIIIK